MRRKGERVRGHKSDGKRIGSTIINLKSRLGRSSSVKHRITEGIRVNDKIALLSIVVLLSLMTLASANLPGAFPLGSVQPPIDTSTYRVGTIGQPRRLDPARAYDTASGEIILNVYQPLIFFGHKPLAPPTTTEITDQYVADLGNFTSMIATKVPSIADGDISADGKNWTFTIRPSAAFHDWMAANGSLITGQILTTEDVVYTFKRMLVQDMLGAPSWMIALPATGYEFLDDLDGNVSTNTIEPIGVPGAGERLAASLIDSFITSDGNTVTFHWFTPWPETMLKQILSQSWSCIVNKAFCIEHGCWNGTFYDGWSTDYRRMPSNSYTPLDSYYAAKSKFTADTTPVMCGTGPYRFTSWDKATKIWRIDKFANYWGGWAGNHVTAVIEEGVDVWPTRKEQFLSGEFDVCTVAIANMWDLLDPSDPSGHTPISGIRLYWNAPSLSNDAVAFLFDVAPDSPYMPKNGTTPTPDLFANVHMRRAFAHALNFTQYLRDAWSNEAIRPASWWLRGMKPDYENKTLTLHDINSTIIQDELKAAGVSEEGFETTFVYVLGSDSKARMPYDIVAATFASLSSKYRCNVVGIDWPTFLNYEEEFFMPTFSVGWLADFGDPEDPARTYMHSEGYLASMQKYNDTHVDYLVDLGISQPDGPARNATYQELQYLYWRDVPSLPLIQAVRRRWEREWVGGWYYNPLYAGSYFYDLYKTLIRNLNTGLPYASIQEALDSPQTLEGHTILVEVGTYHETIVINKSISLRGAGQFGTIIEGTHMETIVNITTDNVNFSGFTIRNGICGVLLNQSSHDVVTENVIMNNQIGISLYSSSNNSIYHNDFVNNTFWPVQTNLDCFNNTWDDGYPSGGNYWSDYAGIDIHSGVYQNETGSDGIGDTPIHGDRYPFMTPHIIPEFSETAILLLSVTTTTLAIAVYNKRRGSSKHQHEKRTC